VSDLTTLCGLWKNKDRNGKPYLSGTLGNARVLVFPNPEKRDQKSPDYRLCIGPRADQERPAPPWSSES
jgi:hypothetical protein